MYRITLTGYEYANVNGEFTKIQTKHRFECPDITSLMQLIGNMAEASTDTLELSITWEEIKNE